MSVITFEPINNQYEWGTYFDFKVLIMTINGYINATKLCRDGGKRFDRWLQNDSSKGLIEKLERSHGKVTCIKITNGINEYRGTYVHEKLIVHIASWISPDHALKVSDIVLEYRLKEQRKLIAEKDDKISELEAKLDAILKDTGNLLNRNDNLESKVSDLTDEVSKLSLDNRITHEKLDDVQNTLDVVVEDRVVRPKDESMINTVIIYEYETNKFRIFRVQKRSAKISVKRYLSKNSNALKFAEIEYNPNSINYFIRFKEQFKSNIKWYYNSFELINITKDQLREFIAKINEEKYELENLF